MPRLQRCVCVGKGNPAIGVVAKTICLSANSVEVLQPQTLLGKGSFACAYRRPDGKVVKITQDKSDVAALEQLQGDPRVVKLHESYRLRGTPYFAVVVDRLRPAPEWMQDIIGLLWRKDEEAGTLPAPDPDAPTEPRKNGNGKVKGDSPMRRFSDPGGHASPTKLSEDVCGFLGPKAGRCRKLIEGIGEFYTRNARRGVFVRDIHKGNIGIDERGDWKLLDVGFQSTTEEARAKELAGLAHNRKRKRNRKR
jgi:hypothetical protein